MKLLKRMGILASLAVFGLMFTGCGGSDGGSNVTPSVTSVAVSPGTTTVALGGSQNFTAIVTVTGGAAQTVNWSIVEAHATGTTITTAGILNVAADETATTLTIKAVSTADNTKSGVATVNIQGVVSVTVNPDSASVAPGETQNFTATVVVTGGAVQTVIWSVEGNQSAGTTITKAGSLTVAADETAPSLTVRATSTADNKKDGVATVTIFGVGSVAVTPPSSGTSVARENTLQFDADVSYVGDVATTVKWSVEGNEAKNTTIDERGLLTISVGESASKLIVKAVSDADPQKFGEIEITISDPQPFYTMKLINSGKVTTAIDYGMDEYPVYAPFGPFADATNNPVTVPSFQIGETEVTYELWYAVISWAYAHKYDATDNPDGYYFPYFPSDGIVRGREGSNGVEGVAPTARKKEPVTNITYRDMVVWCNAYSEMTGRTPAYYLSGTTEFNTSNVIRISEIGSMRTISGQFTARNGAGRADTAVLNVDADGYRLPWETEWEYAARGGNPLDTVNWNYVYAGTDGVTAVELAEYAVFGNVKTESVKSKKSNGAGLYDMTGNVSEMTWGSYAPGTGASDQAAVRGGTWKSAFQSNTSAFYDLVSISRGATSKIEQGLSNADPAGGVMGFRLAMNAPPAPPEDGDGTSEEKSISSVVTSVTDFFGGVVADVKSWWNGLGQ
jgi:formylglycine-generating enzyme required for sulfatase activity